MLIKTDLFIKIQKKKFLQNFYRFCLQSWSELVGICNLWSVDFFRRTKFLLFGANLWWSELILNIYTQLSRYLLSAQILTFISLQNKEQKILKFVWFFVMFNKIFYFCRISFFLWKFVESKACDAVWRKNVIFDSKKSHFFYLVLFFSNS